MNTELTILEMVGIILAVWSGLAFIIGYVVGKRERRHDDEKEYVISHDYHKDDEARSGIVVPVLELAKLERARLDLYQYLEDVLSKDGMLKIVNITGQIWRVANTKDWSIDVVKQVQAASGGKDESS